MVCTHDPYAHHSPNHILKRDDTRVVGLVRNRRKDRSAHREEVRQPPTPRVTHGQDEGGFPGVTAQLRTLHYRLAASSTSYRLENGLRVSSENHIPDEHFLSMCN